MRSLRVNETKVTFRNTFISDLFELRGGKVSKYDERNFGGGSMQKRQSLTYERRI